MRKLLYDGFGDFSVFLLLTILLSTLAACQKEFTEIETPSEDEIVSPGTPLGSFINQIALKDGSFDNVVDRASCLSLEFPYEVLINGNEFEVQGAEDLEILLDTFPSLQEDIVLLYPVRGILPDYTQVNINSLQELLEIRFNCIEGGEDEDIECVDFTYPIRFSTYNLNSKNAKVEEVVSDIDLFNFLAKLKEDELASLLYPITLQVNGAGEEINDNISLEDVIADNVTTCDEADTVNFIVDGDEPNFLSEELLDQLSRIALNDGSFDNVIDRGSCLALKFPYNILLNGIIYTVESTQDVLDVYAGFDSLREDISIEFPVTAILPDYEESIISNQTELDDLISTCIEGGLDPDIECVDFTYPLMLTVHDTVTSGTELIEATSDKDLYLLITGLEIQEAITLEYPLDIQLEDGSDAMVANNMELEMSIDMYKDDCDEADTINFEITIPPIDYLTQDQLDLTRRIALLDGSFDNVIDRSSCVTINYPYTITMEGASYSINDAADVEDILVAFDTLTEDLSINFPVTGTLADFSEVVLNSQGDLNSIISSCVEGGDDEDIECLDFVYPFSLVVFDTVGISETPVEVSSDQELFELISSLTDQEATTIDYPIEIDLYNGMQEIISDNVTFADLVNETADKCDENDEVAFEIGVPMIDYLTATQIDVTRRITLLDGSFDNVIDRSSCISIKFPYTILIDGVNRSITNEADVEQVLIDFETLTADLSIVYPVIGILPDHSEVTLSSQLDLDNIIATCLEGGADEDIECVNFAYPLSITLYDTAVQTDQELTPATDTELHDILTSLSATEALAFTYPVSLDIYDGSQEQVADNSELEERITMLKDVCDEYDTTNFEVNEPVIDYLSATELDLTRRITLRDGSFDNVIDRSSCVTIQFPYTIAIDGGTRSIENESDVSQVLADFETLTEDLSIVFPVVGILPDHSEVTLNSQVDLDNIIASCDEGGIDEDIECIDFNYPLDLTLYDTLADTDEAITSNSDEELHGLITNLSVDEVLTFTYDINLLIFDGTQEIVSTNDAYENAINLYKDNCDEYDTTNFEVVTTPTIDYLTTTQVDLARRIALNDGSYDNVIDRSSCVALVFPYDISMEGETLTIANQQDIDEVLEALDTLTEDIAIIYPVNGILADHSSVILNSQSDLDDIISSCTEGGSDEDIECVDFEYPITVTVYDTIVSSETPQVVSTDNVLHDLITGLGADEAITIDYPINVNTSLPEQILISDNDAFESAVTSNAAICDEEDNIDFGVDPVSNLEELLIANSWEVQQFRDQNNETKEFDGMIFDFESDGTMTVQIDTTTISGDWSVTNSTELTLTLNYSTTDPPIVWLNDNWEVSNFNKVNVIMTAPGATPSGKRLILNNKL